jgi:hypothetical protein
VIALGLVVTLVAWAVLWLIGEACARLVFGTRYASIATATRLPLGLAATICFLEAAGYFLPIRIAAWLLVAPAAYGAVLVRRGFYRSGGSLRRVVVASSVLALAVGLMPIAIARRFTAAALTNNDSTYYITAADYLVNVRWAVNYGDAIPDHLCLIERVLHGWNWRTGTPNLMATVSTLSGVGSPEALSVVTALLFACVPPAVIGIVHNLGVATRCFRWGVRHCSEPFVWAASGDICTPRSFSARESRHSRTAARYWCWSPSRCSRQTCGGCLVRCFA